ncbi:uncharacterized protein BXZ73DRAFT_107455 [Epithele typhae]|uniref:uncharacterized protein n=1 Tax=Epithele typhae TaxID=378194 RepID=UPI0020085429|nr:uncharacterized protein BXZ73DRAFT_107455 [Epithele typhae]KAH9912407.1 hypothetical protein BXZ73DRAFT_107455 [Epithele typhae]
MSENADFAERFALEGIAFIGPPASAIVSMGSNSVSKNIMSAVGVLVVPGHHGNQDLDFLQQEALRIDYPVLIKPVPRSNTLITELDVIQRQLEVAAGDALLLDQSSIPLVRRAFESRLYAENPRNFLPDSGQLAHLSTPTPTHIFTAPPGVQRIPLGESSSPFMLVANTSAVIAPSLRVEQGFEQGTQIGFFQSSTNIKFLRALGGNQAFTDGDVETGFIPKHFHELFPPTPEPPDEALAQAITITLQHTSLSHLLRHSLASTVAASLPDSFSPTFAAVSAVLESPLTFAGARARTTMVPPPAPASPSRASRSSMQAPPSCLYALLRLPGAQHHVPASRLRFLALRLRLALHVVVAY